MCAKTSPFLNESNLEKVKIGLSHFFIEYLLKIIKYHIFTFFFLFKYFENKKENQLE